MEELTMAINIYDPSKLKILVKSRISQCDHKGYISINIKWVGCGMCGARWKLPDIMSTSEDS